MVDGSMNECISRYQTLKEEYYQLQQSKNKSKGHIRAFVGLKTWIYERERVEAGEKLPCCHINAFEEALVEAKETPDDFSTLIDRVRKVWDEHQGGIERKNLDRPIAPPPIQELRKFKTNGYNVVSLFSGALGLDLGFLAAGFDIKLATDIDDYSRMTLENNLPDIPFVLNDFATVSSNKILSETGLDVGEIDVLTGGQPCQPFSTAGKRKGFSDPRSSPLKEFIRAINDLQPKIFVIEEVTGILSSRLKHVPISERNGRKLLPDEEKGSVFKIVLEMLNSTGYHIRYDVLNAADFGTPQERRRVIIIGCKSDLLPMPKPTHSNTPNAGGSNWKQETLFDESTKPWVSFWEAVTDLHKNKPEYLKLSENRCGYMILIPPGGNWRHLPKDSIRQAMGGAYNSGGGKMGFYRRLSWDEPSPTLVTSPAQKGSMLVHPEEPRPLSIEEYKRIQGFPDDWILPGSTATKYRLIGNAVPVHMSYQIASHLVGYL